MARVGMWGTFDYPLTTPYIRVNSWWWSTHLNLSLIGLGAEVPLLLPSVEVKEEPCSPPRKHPSMGGIIIHDP
jgi:hypothetical protein